MSISSDIFIDDICYRTGREETRIPYEVLNGTRIIKDEHLPVKSWIQKHCNSNLFYLYEGNCICIEHGHYIKGVLLYFLKHDTPGDIRQELFNTFKFEGLADKEHSGCNIKPYQAISIITLEDELRELTDDFIYWRLRKKAEAMGAGLEFTSKYCILHWGGEYEMRLCFKSNETLELCTNNKQIEDFKRYFSELINKNNYFNNYSSEIPPLRLVIK